MSARNVVSVRESWTAVARVLNFVVRFLKEWEKQGLDVYDFIDVCTETLIREMIKAVKHLLCVKELYRDPAGRFCLIKLSPTLSHIGATEIITKIESRGYRLPPFRDYEDLNKLMLLGDQALQNETECIVILPIRGSEGVSAYGIAEKPIVRTDRGLGRNYKVIPKNEWQWFPDVVFSKPLVVVSAT